MEGGDECGDRDEDEDNDDIEEEEEDKDENDGIAPAFSFPRPLADPVGPKFAPDSIGPAVGLFPFFSAAKARARGERTNALCVEEEEEEMDVAEDAEADVVVGETCSCLLIREGEVDCSSGGGEENTCVLANFGLDEDAEDDEEDEEEGDDEEDDDDDCVRVEKKCPLLPFGAGDPSSPLWLWWCRL